METTLRQVNKWLNEFAYKSSAKGWGNVHQVCILKTKMLIWEKLGEQRNKQELNKKREVLKQVEQKIHFKTKVQKKIQKTPEL